MGFSKKECTCGEAFAFSMSEGSKEELSIKIVGFFCIVCKIDG